MACTGTILPFFLDADVGDDRDDIMTFTVMIQDLVKL
jgi:hypothetical protein